MNDPLTRAHAYVAAMEPAVSGQKGHTATFKVALALVHGFALSEAEAMPIMVDYNSRCQPPWSQKELAHKLRSAATHASRKPRGHLRDASRYTPYGQLRDARPAVASVENFDSPRPKKEIPLSEVGLRLDPKPEPPKADAPDSQPSPAKERESAAPQAAEGGQTWLDGQMALFADHGHVECAEDERLLRSFLAIVSEESDHLGLAVTDDEARAAALALRKDLVLGLFPTPEDGRPLVPMTLELLRRIGLGHPLD